MVNEVKQGAFSLRSILEQYPREQASLLPILQEVQHANRYIAEETIPEIARHVRMTPLQVYAVLSFYKELRTAPPGEVLIRLCDGPACHVKGMERIRRTMEESLGISLWETTPDGRFTLEMYPCNGTCDHAPYLTINGVPYSRVSPSQVVAMLEEWGWQPRAETRTTRSTGR